MSYHNIFGFNDPYENDIWDSEAHVINLHSKEDMPTIYIPYKLLLIFKKIHSEYPDVEVGVFVKGKFDEKFNVYVSDKVYVPEQEVSGGDIVFKESPPKGYNGVIHKHPIGVKSFSFTDHENINRNFEFSILYEDTEGFCDACIRVHIDNNRFIIIPAKIELVIDDIKFKIPKNKIKRRYFHYSHSSLFNSRRSNAKNINFDKVISFDDLMVKYGFKEVKPGIFEKIEADGMHKYRIKVERNSAGGYKFLVINPETDETLYNTTCYDISDLEFYISTYADLN